MDAAETSAPVDAIDVVDVGLGDCIVYPEDRELEQPTAATDAPMTLDTVPCERPHDTEVYAIFDLPEEDYPGDEAVMSAADEGCYAEFEAFVGNAYENSLLDIEYFFPSKESWSWDGDRQVTCMVYHLEGEPLTGSAAGSGL